MYGNLSVDMHNLPCRKCRFCCEKDVPKKSCYSTMQIFHGTIVLFVLSFITLACNLWILKENNDVRKAIAAELYKSSIRTSDNTMVSTTGFFLLYSKYLIPWLMFTDLWNFMQWCSDAWFYSEKKKHILGWCFSFIQSNNKTILLNSNCNIYTILRFVSVHISLSWHFT